MKKDLILVVGASGTVGSEIVSQLKSQGYRTRSTTSKKTNLVEDQVYVNLATGEGVHSAFEGIDRAFFLAPPGFADQYALISPLVQEAKRRGLKKVVLMSAMGANANEATPFRRAEIELEKSGLNYNIIRPNWFFQNFNTFWIQGINQQNQILLPAGQAQVSFIDARDISNVAVTLLTSHQFDQRDFDLTGPEAVNHDDVAKALSLATGRNIEYKEIQPEQLKQGLLAAQLPEDYANFLLMIMGFLKEGYNSRKTESVTEITGKPARTLAQYANDYKNCWIK